MRVPSTVMLMIFLGASAVLSGQLQQENWKRCENNDPEQRIAPCSALIQSGRETASNLAKKCDPSVLPFPCSGGRSQPCVYVASKTRCPGPAIVRLEPL
jgi:hypothetical protein